MLPLAAVLAAILALSSPAFAIPEAPPMPTSPVPPAPQLEEWSHESRCAPRKAVVADLTSKKTNESQIGVGMINNRQVLELFSSNGKDNDTWSMLVTDARGKSCLVVWGEVMDSRPPAMPKHLPSPTEPLVQKACYPWETRIAQVSERSEMPVWTGRADTGNVVQVFISHDQEDPSTGKLANSWSALVTRPDGTMCPVASGIEWESVPDDVAGSEV